MRGDNGHHRSAQRAEAVGRVQAGHDRPAVGVLAAHRGGIRRDVQYPVRGAEAQRRGGERDRHPAAADQGETQGQTDPADGQQLGQPSRPGEATADLEAGDHADRGGEQDPGQPGRAESGGFLDRGDPCSPDGHHDAEAGEVTRQQATAPDDVVGYVEYAIRRHRDGACHEGSISAATDFGVDDDPRDRRWTDMTIPASCQGQRHTDGGEKDVRRVRGRMRCATLHVSKTEATRQFVELPFGTTAGASLHKMHVGCLIHPFRSRQPGGRHGVGNTLRSASASWRRVRLPTWLFGSHRCAVGRS